VKEGRGGKKGVSQLLKRGGEACKRTPGGGKGNLLSFLAADREGGKEGPGGRRKPKQNLYSFLSFRFGEKEKRKKKGKGGILLAI